MKGMYRQNIEALMILMEILHVNAAINETRNIKLTCFRTSQEMRHFVPTKRKRIAIKVSIKYCVSRICMLDIMGMTYGFNRSMP